MSLPETMTVVAMNGKGGPEVLELAHRNVPEAHEGEILIRVAAAGVNRPDILQRKGAYPPPPGASDLLGLEVSGTVAALGPGTHRYAVGDRVCALVPGGGYAEYVKTPEPQALPIPTGLTMREAAALPETFFTVWTNVFERGGLKAGETLLVHGGTSGIGTTAIMLAKAFGARVIATAGSPEKCAAIVALGADRAVNYRDEDFVDAVKAVTSGRGADVILDMVGGSYIERNYEAAAECGRVVQIAFLEAAKAEVNFTKLMTKRLIHTGSTLRPRSIAEKRAIANALESKVWPIIASGQIRPVMDRAFTLSEAAAAHRCMEAGDHIGKIVLTVAEDAFR
ncbi:NAD(P)H-quinone oxidoreductase [Lichenifustis flavocetrariae]|uniref:NAD(P)H-quinone oxidoreductase n=1 Tax=Lichenifustis flavocetrariae TaxID=2949735 RepID=A0AA41YZW1_9HYPH|nr:NAD(P)H-quinone oxidoreductase [Lichenifustis flavocetrariae]MCW6507900.1 NAD(P)H-quinone oxidoreductase [Lichenifustis flavocetrariae]